MIEVAGEVIGYLDLDAFELDQPLTDQGFDSLMAVELRNQLGQRIGTSLPVSLLFDYPTVNDITKYLLRDVFELAGDEAEEPEGEEETMSTDDVLGNIEQLIGDREE